MSTLALDRIYQLQLPDSFVDIDREEMEYIDGGNWGVPQSWIRVTTQIFQFLCGKAIMAGLAAIGINVENWFVDYAVGWLLGKTFVINGLKAAAAFVWSPQGMAMITAIIFTVSSLGVYFVAARKR